MLCSSALLDFLQAREIVPIEPPNEPHHQEDKRRTSSSHNPSTDNKAIKKEKKPILDGVENEGPSKKRSLSSINVIDLSDDSDDLAQLDPEDLAHLARIKVRFLLCL